MSGIFGIINEKAKTSTDEIDISPMLSWNRIYGRDKEEIFQKGNAAFGCCLDILSDKHVQTTAVLSYEENIAVIDALIYNRNELMAKCEVSEDTSDAELLLFYILKYGFSALKDVNGDFAGAVYNENSRKLTLFRDHMGVRPLFYYINGPIAVYSTDLRGMAALPEVETDIRQEWIYDTVSGYDSETIDSTPYENIRCVPPASFIELEIRDGAMTCEKFRYWKLGQNKIRYSSNEEYYDRLRHLVTDAVKTRLDAVSGIVGAELSGGLDSGVIDILISRLGRECIYYSWSPSPEEIEMTYDDERKVIGDICDQENIKCYFSHKSSSEEISDDFKYSLPENTNTLTIMTGSRFVKEKGAKVMFTGHGGDEGVSHRASVYEMFANGEYYHYWRYIWRITTRKPRVIRTLKKGIKNILESYSSNNEVYMNWFASPELLNTEISKRYSGRKHDRLKFDYAPISYIESGGSRNRLDNIALQGAYSGVRYLIPFCDFRVMDFAVSIPRNLYISEKYKRYIFRETFKDIMPQSLYKLNSKEDTSMRNVKVDPEWFKKYDRRKKEIIDHLDRDYWERYLDYSVIDSLYKKGEPLECEYLDDMRHMKALLKCALAKNLLDSAKRLT